MHCIPVSGLVCLPGFLLLAPCLRTVTRPLTRLQALPATEWPAGSLASTLLAALLLSRPVEARQIVKWAWRHSEVSSAGQRGSYPGGNGGVGVATATSSYLRRAAVRELVAAAVFLLRHKEARNGRALCEQAASLHDAILGAYQVGECVCFPSFLLPFGLMIS